MSDETADSGEKWHPLAVLVGSGRSVKTAADTLGIAERTAYRYAESNEFRARVSSLRSAIASEAVGRLTSAASTAVDTLLELTAREHEPKTRLDACKLILVNLLPLSEHCELRQRLDSLEQTR